MSAPHMTSPPPDPVKTAGEFEQQSGREDTDRPGVVSEGRALMPGSSVSPSARKNTGRTLIISSNKQWSCNPEVTLLVEKQKVKGHPEPGLGTVLHSPRGNQGVSSDSTGRSG